MMTETVFSSSLPLLSEETVVTGKLDGANCSIYHGNNQTLLIIAVPQSNVTSKAFHSHHEYNIVRHILYIAGSKNVVKGDVLSMNGNVAV